MKVKDLKVKYSILPARIIGEKRFKIAHYNVMCALGVHASKSGLVFATHETIAGECPHVQTTTIKKAINDLVTWGYVHRLEPKYMKGQKSRYLTNRYMVVWEGGQDIPPYEELQKQYYSEIVADGKQDETVKGERQAVQEGEVLGSILDQKVVRKYHAMILNACSQVYGNIPNYSLREIEIHLDNFTDDAINWKYIKYFTHDNFIEVFTQIKATNKNLPTVKEVFNAIKNR